jgi:putative endonuclease
VSGVFFASRDAVVTVARQRFGKSGEDRAVAELERLRYEILARRYRTKHGEIDIVARDGETTVFVEVKARATAEFGTAAEAVTVRKQRKLVAMAMEYLALNRLPDIPCRFDVIAIDGVGDTAVVTHYRGAFEVA